MKIRAKTLMCGEVELQGKDHENVIVLGAICNDWRIGGGVHVVMPEAELVALEEDNAKLVETAKHLDIGATKLLTDNARKDKAIIGVIAWAKGESGTLWDDELRRLKAALTGSLSGSSNEQIKKFDTAQELIDDLNADNLEERESDCLTPDGEKTDKLHDRFAEMIDELPQTGDALTCEWRQSDLWDTPDVWETECGNMFYFGDGKPLEDGIDYCCYCGKKIVRVDAKIEDDDE